MSESMTVEQAIEFARYWQQDLTPTPGTQGWRVVCMVLADEVETLQKRVAVRGELCRALEASKQQVEQERDELRRRVAALESQLEDAHYEIIEAGERRSE